MNPIERTQGGITERFVCAMAQPDEEPTSLFARVAAAASPGACVTLDVFGGQPGETVLAALGQAFDGVAPPTTWVCEADARPGSVHAVQAWIVEGAPVKRLYHGDVAVGSVFEDGHARYVRLAGLLPQSSAAPETQTREILDTMLALLGEAKLDFSHVVRTWFYCDDILAWYGQFNAARDAFFREHGVFDGLVPASTGMGGGNIAGRALLAGLLAVQPKTAGAEAIRVDSPLQCPAWDYGSSFSRAVEIATPASRRLMVSGTASIAQEGHTLHLGDLESQIRETFTVVEAILESRGMQWSQVTRALGYFKPGQNADRMQLLQDLAPPIPIVPVTNHVCRDDLLFETELEALITE